MMSIKFYLSIESFAKMGAVKGANKYSHIPHLLPNLGEYHCKKSVHHAFEQIRPVITAINGWGYSHIRSKT
jgi:hypothetical protein